MDPKQQQEDELMVLESVYMNEFEAVSRNYPNIEVRLTFPTVPEGAQGRVPEEYIFDVTLMAKLSAKYPDELPVLRISGLEDKMGSAVSDRLLTELKMIAEQNLGMPSIFTVASDFIDKLEKLINDTADKKEQIELEARQKEEEKAFKEYEADKVTVESFKEWRKKFEDETRHLREEAKRARLGNNEGRLTGRQMFIQNKLLELKLDDTLDIPEDEKAGVEGLEIDESLYTDEIELPDSEDDED